MKFYYKGQLVRTTKRTPTTGQSSKRRTTAP